MRGLNQGTTTVLTVPRGTDRTDAVTQFVDVRFSKSFDLGNGMRIEGQLDLFNALNANHVDRQIDVIGSSLGNAIQILNGRIIRFGGRFTF